MEVEFLVGNRWQRPDILVKVDHQLEMSMVRNEDGADRDDGLAGDDDTEKADEDKLIMQMMMRPRRRS